MAGSAVPVPPNRQTRAGEESVMTTDMVPDSAALSTLTLTLKEWLSPHSLRLWFRDEPRIEFRSGQFMQVVLPHDNPDDRGIRRFFTIASSPTEEGIAIITKVPEPCSSFKRALVALEPGGTLAVTSLRGSFVLPERLNAPCAFLAAGIGITPFRSMVKYMIDTGRHCPATLLYGEWCLEEFLCRGVFQKAQETIGLRPVYTITGPDVPPDWTGRAGFISPEMIIEEIPDYRERLFFVCGPPMATKSMETILHDLGVPRDRIHRDYFPGY